jgi:hypothetical protein
MVFAHFYHKKCSINAMLFALTEGRGKGKRRGVSGRRFPGIIAINGILNK